MKSLPSHYKYLVVMNKHFWPYSINTRLLVELTNTKVK